MPCPLRHATCRAWIRLLTTGVSSSAPLANRITRPTRCSARSLSSSASATNGRPRPTATPSPATTTTTSTQQQSTAPAKQPTSPSTSTIPPPTSHTLTPEILSQFHNTTAAQARTLLTTLLTTRSTTLTPADYATLIRLAHHLTPPPHTLVLTLYSAFVRRWGLAAAPAELFHFVLPVLYGHDRHEEVLRLWEWVVRLGRTDQVVLGVVLRSCVVQQDGKLAWELFSKYRAPQRTEGELEEMMEQEEAEEQKAANSGEPGSATTDRRREKATLARFVEESLFPHSSFQGFNRSGLSSPTSAFNLLHYTHIVSALRYHPYHASQALAVLWHMHTHGVRPDSLFYNRLLGTLTTRALPACSLYVLRDMEARGMPIDGRVYYFVITSHALRGRWSAVVRLIAEMAERGLEVNEHVYEAAVVCCAEAGLVERAKRIVAEMQRRGVPITWRCYGALVAMAGQVGDWQWALQLFDIARDRADFRKQLLANDAVLEAVVRAEERGEPTGLQMTAEQVYRHYFPQVIGPRGLWLIMGKAVEAERECGVLECGSEVRELLTTATTPLTATHIGRMHITEHRPAEHEQASSSSSSSSRRRASRNSRQYRLHVPNGSIDETTASLDTLLLCMLHQSAAARRTSRVDEAELGWREHLASLPTCGDTLLVVTPKDVYPTREWKMARQLRDDTIYAARDADRATEAAEEAEEGDVKADVAEAEAAVEQQWSEQGEQSEQGDEEVTPDEDDPAAAAVAQAEAEQGGAAEVEAPSIGHFVVDTVNSLIHLVSSRSSSHSSHSHSALTGETNEASCFDGRRQRGPRVLSAVASHLRSVYGIETRRSDDRSFHRLTLTPQQMTRWVERELVERRRSKSTSSGHRTQQRPRAATDTQRMTGTQQTRRESGQNRAERTDSVKAQAEAEQPIQPIAQEAVT